MGASALRMIPMTSALIMTVKLPQLSTTLPARRPRCSKLRSTYRALTQVSALTRNELVVHEIFSTSNKILNIVCGKGRRERGSSKVNVKEFGMTRETRTTQEQAILHHTAHPRCISRNRDYTSIALDIHRCLLISASLTQF